MKWQNPSGTPTYNSWKAMIARCDYWASANADVYKRNNIVVTPAWYNYDVFFKDMGERPAGTTLDRLDGRKGYRKQNCRWATWVEQQRNKEGLTCVTHAGIQLSISEWCSALELTEREKGKVYKRYNAYGCTSFEKLFCDNLATYKHSQRVNECKVCGKTHTIKWRKQGQVCNTCYHQARRWASRWDGIADVRVDDYPAWANIDWECK